MKGQNMPNFAELISADSMSREYFAELIFADSMSRGDFVELNFANTKYKRLENGVPSLFCNYVKLKECRKASLS